MFRFIGKPLVFLCLTALAGGVSSLTGGVTEKSNKELVEYILNAQKLGLKEAEIKQNAVKAGWDKGSVDQAFTVVKYLNTTGTAATKPGDLDLDVLVRSQP